MTVDTCLDFPDVHVKETWFASTKTHLINKLCMHMRQMLLEYSASGQVPFLSTFHAPETLPTQKYEN